MREIYDLISSADKIAGNLISHDCSYGIRLATREHFKEMLNESDFKDEKIIKTLSITMKGQTEIFPL